MLDKHFLPCLSLMDPGPIYVIKYMTSAQSTQGIATLIHPKQTVTSFRQAVWTNQIAIAKLGNALDSPVDP